MVELQLHCQPAQDLPALTDPEEQQAILKLIDQRQDLLLEDLNRLNQQIVDVIEVYTLNRASKDQPATQDAAA